MRIAQKVVNSSLIQTAIHERDLRHYWLDSKGIPETAEVDWNSIAKASRAIRRGKGVFLTKFFSGFCGVNRWRKKWGMAESDQCGRCLQAVESTEHLWVCRADEAKALRENKVDEIIGSKAVTLFSAGQCGRYWGPFVTMENRHGPQFRWSIEKPSRPSR